MSSVLKDAPQVLEVQHDSNPMDNYLFYCPPLLTNLWAFFFLYRGTLIGKIFKGRTLLFVFTLVHCAP